MRKYLIGLILLVWLTSSCSPGPKTSEAASATPTQGGEQVTARSSSTPQPTLTSTPPPLLPTTNPEPGLPVPFSGMKMINSLEGWAWSIDEVWRTADGGLSWLQITPPDYRHFEYALDTQTAWATVFQPGGEDSPTILVGTTDGGENWSQLSETAWKLGAQYTFYDSENGLGYNCAPAAGTGICLIQETNDGGQSWTPLEFAFDPQGNPIETPGQFIYCSICGDSLYFDLDKLVLASGNMVEFSATYIPVRITLDRGQSWLFQSLSLPEGEFSPGLIDPYRAVFFGGQEGLLPVQLANDDYDLFGTAFYFTEDEGMSWSFRSLIEIGTSNLGWATMDFVDSQTLFFSCGEDLCFSQDGARTWQRRASNLSFNFGEDRAAVRKFDFSDSQAGWALAGEEWDQLYLWKTLNGGITWEMLSPTFTP